MRRYAQWRQMFSVEEGGDGADDSAEDEGMLARFVQYIKDHKVSVLEDLAREFKLKVPDAIARVKAAVTPSRAIIL